MSIMFKENGLLNRSIPRNVNNVEKIRKCQSQKISITIQEKL